MKRFSIFMVTLMIGCVSIMSIPVKGFNSDPLTFIQSMENLQNLKSYRLNQNLVGTFEIAEGTEAKPLSLSGKYRLKINSDTYNNAPFQVDTASLIRGHISVDADGVEKPFARLNINFRAELITKAEEGLYARLSTFNLNAEGVPKAEMTDYLDFKKEIEQKLTEVKGIWFYFPEEAMGASANNELPEGLSDNLNAEIIRKNLKEKGIEETYQQVLSDALDSMVTTESMEKGQSDKIKKLVDDFFGTNFFTKKIVVDGPQKGFTNYTLNKRQVVAFLMSAASAMGETFTENDLKELWTILDKFFLSVMTHEDTTWNVLDFFRLKVVLRDIEVLKELTFNYSYKMGKINELEAISEPDEFTSYDALRLPFLPAPTQIEEEILLEVE